jgi:hypothetical protein
MLPLAGSCPSEPNAKATKEKGQRPTEHAGKKPLVVVGPEGNTRCQPALLKIRQGNAKNAEAEKVVQEIRKE